MASQKEIQLSALLHLAVSELFSQCRIDKYTVLRVNLSVIYDWGVVENMFKCNASKLGSRANHLMHTSYLKYMVGIYLCYVYTGVLPKQARIIVL